MEKLIEWLPMMGVFSLFWIGYTVFAIQMSKRHFRKGLEKFDYQKRKIIALEILAEKISLIESHLFWEDWVNSSPRAAKKETATLTYPRDKEPTLPKKRGRPPTKKKSPPTDEG